MWEKYSHIIPHIAVDSGVITTVADWVRLNKYTTILVVCDPNTLAVAGNYVIDSLKSVDLTVHECCFAEEEPVPDEGSIGFLTSFFTSKVDLILGVGSGTINDLCTYVGAKVGCPSAIVATAPSMDGYASLGSAMLLGGVKVTPPTQCPVAIFCDIDILSEAPLLLTAAGLGDMLGKVTALADWRLAHLLVEEPMPEDIVSIVDIAFGKILKNTPKLAKRDPAVIKSITEGLILSGIAMSLYKDSRPASGTEHHLAHFWEMRMIAEDKKPALHGIKVGLATIIGLVMWRELAVYLNDFSETQNRPSLISKTEANLKEAPEALYEQNIKRLYGRFAESILETKNPGLSPEFINKNIQAILDIANSLPSPDAIAAMLKSVHAPTLPSEIDLSADTLHDSIIYARDRKKVYTLLQLLGDLDCLEDFTEKVVRYFTGKALNKVKCFVLDMDGTIYLGSKIFPYTLKFLKHLDLIGKDYIFYTNNSSQNADYYLTKLRSMGIETAPGKLMMSTHVLLSHLKNCYKKVFIAGTKALREDFKAAGYILDDTDPDFVVLGFDTDIDYNRLVKLCDFVRAGIPYYGVHIDYNCPVEGGFIPDCGSLAAAVTASTGVTPEFFGKPSRHTLDYIIENSGYRESEICFVGDRLYTDIAIASGTKATSVLVLSGETKQRDLQGSLYVPDIIVKNLGELIAFL